MSTESEMRAILQELHEKFNTRVYGASSYIKRDMRDRIEAVLAAAPQAPSVQQAEPNVLLMALAQLRWLAFGECRTEGWSGPPPTASDTEKALRAALASQPSERPAPDQWKQAIDDELATLLSTADIYPSAKEAVKALIDWHVSVALDPAVSSEAQALIDKGKAEPPAVQQAAATEPKALLKDIDPWRQAVDDALIAHALDCTGPGDDPKEKVEELLGWAVTIATDPRVAEQAGAVPTVEQAIEALKIALRDSKGWMMDYSDSVIRDAIDRTGAREQVCGVCFETKAFTGTCGGGRENPRALCYQGDAITKPVIYIDETGALQSSLGSKETEAVLGPLVDHMRLHSATGAEPVAYRYKIGKCYEYRPMRLTHYFWDDVNERYIQGEPLYLAAPAIATVQAQEPVDVEQMLRDCVPGGCSVDPQPICDNIRAWFAGSTKSEGEA